MMPIFRNLIAPGGLTYQAYGYIVETHRYFYRQARIAAREEDHEQEAIPTPAHTPCLSNNQFYLQEPNRENGRFSDIRIRAIRTTYTDIFISFPPTFTGTNTRFFAGVDKQDNPVAVLMYKHQTPRQVGRNADNNDSTQNNRKYHALGEENGPNRKIEAAKREKIDNLVNMNKKLSNDETPPFGPVFTFKNNGIEKIARRNNDNPNYLPIHIKPGKRSKQYLVMPLLGPDIGAMAYSLFDKLLEETPPPSQTDLNQQANAVGWILLDEFIKALEPLHLHREGLMHLDVKTESLVLRHINPGAPLAGNPAQGFFRMLGLSQCRQERTPEPGHIRRGALIGSFGLYAPEQIRPEDNPEDLTRACDIWSVAVSIIRVVGILLTPENENFTYVFEQAASQGRIAELRDCHQAYEAWYEEREQPLLARYSDGFAAFFAFITDEHLARILRDMMHPNPANRPTIDRIRQRCDYHLNHDMSWVRQIANQLFSSHHTVYTPSVQTSLDNVRRWRGRLERRFPELLTEYP